MKESRVRQKEVSLTFRGLAYPPEEVVRLVGVDTPDFGVRGQPVRPGVKTLLTRSYVRYSLNVSDNHLMVDMIPALIAWLGGIDNILRAKDSVRPEFIEIDLELPVIASEESQSGFLNQAVIADLFALNASVSFGFF